MKRTICILSSFVVLALMIQASMAEVSPELIGSHSNNIEAQHQANGSEVDAAIQQQIENFVEQLAADIVPNAGPSLSPSTSGCVEVDIELPALVEFDPAGGNPPVASGYFEILNCGDESAEILLDLEATVVIGDIFDTTFAIGGIPVTLGAGEVISRELTFGVPPFDGSYTFCVTATSGDAIDEDCATMEVDGMGGFEPTSSAPGNTYRTSKEDLLADYNESISEEDVAEAVTDFTNSIFGQIIEQPLFTPETTECVEVDLELPDTLFVENGLTQGSGYFELINCGDEAAEIELQLEATVSFGPLDTTFVFPAIPIMMAAGEIISHEFMITAPPFNGSYTFCVNATSGEAQDTDCATMNVVGDDFPGPDPSATTGITAQNYPNPFNPTTTVSLYLPSDAAVKVEIYNILGRVVKTLADDYFSAGTHEFQWNGTDGNGNKVASGIYFYRVESGSYSQAKKMLLMK